MSKKNKDIEVRVEEEKAQYNGANDFNEQIIYWSKLIRLFISLKSTDSLI